MEQGLNNQITSNITNIDSITEGNTYVLTRNNNNIIVEQNTENIAGLNTVNRFNIYGLTRNLNNELVPDQLPDLILNTEQVVSDTDYVITRDGGENLIARELGENNVRIPKPITGDLFYAIRKQGNNFTLNRTPALTDYIFEAEELQFFATFNVFSMRSSRAVHVCNTSGKIVKIGLLHVDLSSYEGLINREYRFNVIINDNNQQLIAINPNNSVGSSSSRTLDVENFNIFINAGDFLGIRYQRDGGANEGNYCQVRVTVDTNARRSGFDERGIP